MIVLKYRGILSLDCEIMINPNLYSPHANTSVTKYKKIPFTPQIARADVSKMQNNQTTPHCIVSIETGK